MSVSHLKTLGQAGDLKKWSDLAEILHTCSLGESLGVFFSFFQIFHFLRCGHVPKRQHEAKNFGAGWRLRKSYDLAEILPTSSLGEYLGVFFSFLQNFDF